MAGRISEKDTRKEMIDPQLEEVLELHPRPEVVAAE